MAAAAMAMAKKVFRRHFSYRFSVQFIRGGLRRLRKYPTPNPSRAGEGNFLCRRCRQSRQCRKTGFATFYVVGVVVGMGLSDTYKLIRLANFCNFFTFCTGICAIWESLSRKWRRWRRRRRFLCRFCTFGNMRWAEHVPPLQDRIAQKFVCVNLNPVRVYHGSSTFLR